MALVSTAVDGTVERRVLSAMILSKSVLGRVSARWDGKLFRSNVANNLAALCVSFYRKHNDAPGKAIDSLYSSWAESQTNQKQAEELGRYLQSLSDEYKQTAEKDLNQEHIIDVAGKHFQEVRQERLSEEIGAALAAHDYDRVDRLLEAYRKVELGVGAGINLFNDQEEVQAIFAANEVDVLIPYEGPLGEFFGFDLARDSFVAFVGSDKSGKSWILQDIAWRAMCNRKRVAYFEAGDLSKYQVETRFMVRAAQWPSRSTNKKDPFWPCKVSIPTKLEVKEDAKTGRRRAFVVEAQEKIFDGPLTYDKAWKACERVMKKKVCSEQPYFKLSVHPNSSLTIDMIRSALDGYAMEDWHADVLVIDYSDILDWPPGAKDEREAYNKTWKQLRKLSQELHGLVVTATQADAAAYDVELITRKNFSGDRRKNDHITSMVAVNRTDDEKARGICRLNITGRRDGEFDVGRCVHVAQCLSLARPTVISSF